MRRMQDLFSSPVVVFDGGVATELYERGFYINRPFEELNTSHGRDVSGVHEAYLDAGAMIVTTNSFSLTSPQLDKFDLKTRQGELLRASISLAREAVSLKGKGRVGLSLGPMGVLIEPLGPVSRDEVRTEYANLTREALRNPGYDLYILETFSNLDELEYAIEGIRSLDTLRPLLASITVQSSEPASIEAFAQRIGTRTDVDALGMNCSEGPHDLLQSLKWLRPLTSQPIVIQPNAGIPRNINGRYFYMTSPDYLAKYAKRFIEAGAWGVGGCCGTGPDHIRAIAQAMKMMEVKVAPAPSSLRVESGIEIIEKVTPQRRPLEERKKSRLAQALRSGGKVISVELTSPRGTDLAKFESSLDRLRDAGVAFVNVPDGARASTRVSSLHLAAHVNRNPERGLSVIPHLTTRDRNLIALQSDLLGASVNGVHDLLLVTGDPPKLGNSKDATAVYDIDSIGLTWLVDRLNQGLTPQGDPLGSRTDFCIGVASNPTAINLALELERWRYKVESGADFAVTQPIYEPDTFKRWKEKIQAQDRPHLVGIWPFVSYKNAEFMAHEVPGVHVPAWALEKMSLAQDDSERAIRTGIELSVEVMRSLWHDCEGFAISAPLGKVDVVLEVLQCLR